MIYIPKILINYTRKLIRNDFRMVKYLQRSKASLGKMVRLCPGKRHAWFESSTGIIRKPIKL